MWYARVQSLSHGWHSSYAQPTWRSYHRAFVLKPKLHFPILLGVGRILPPSSVEGYPSPKEPSCEYVRRILRNTNVDDSSCHAKCMQGLRHSRRPASRERRNLRSSQVRGWRWTRRRGGTSDTSRLRNLRRFPRRRIGGQGGRRTSRAAEPRNLRHGQAEEPPTNGRRRIGRRAEDPSLRPAEALDRRRTRGSQCEITRTTQGQ